MREMQVSSGRIRATAVAGALAAVALGLAGCGGPSGAGPAAGTGGGTPRRSPR